MPGKGSACWILVLVLACTLSARAQTAPNATSGTPSASGQMTEWEDEVSTAVSFLHTLFPSSNPSSKIIMENDGDWYYSASRLNTFTIYICDPDFSSRNAELRENFFTQHDIQCSVLTMQATFVMGGSPLRTLPGTIRVGTPALEKR